MSGRLSRRTRTLGWSVFPCLTIVLLSSRARAQEPPALAAAPAEPAPAPIAGEAAPNPEPSAPETAPGAPQSPPPPSEAVGPGPGAPPPEAPGVTSPPATGSAAFAPLPEVPSTRATLKPAAVSANPAQPPPVAESASVAPTSESSAGALPAASGEQSDRHPHAGALWPFRLGVLVGTGLPEILNLGGQLKVTRFFGVGVNVGLIPTVKLGLYGDATVAFQEYDAYGHIYPFGGAFFVGAGVGYATVHGTLSQQYDLSKIPLPIPIPIPSPIVTVNSEASVRTLVLTPKIGFMHVFDVGFAIGFDIGAQIPIAPSKVEFSTVAPEIPPAIAAEARRQYIDPNDAKVRDTLEKVGRTPLPTFGFKIGWFL